MASRWRWLGSAIVAVGLGAAAWGGWRWWESRRLREELDRARDEIKAGRYNTARERLVALPKSYGGGDEVEYQLGICELYRGQRGAAIAAWERIPPGSDYAGLAAMQRGMLAMDSGHFARAEEILQDAIRRIDRTPGKDTERIYQALEFLYQIEGRKADARKLILASWPFAASPAAVLKQLYRLDTSPTPEAMIQGVLAKADNEDDRVWLARANLALRAGRLDEAARWLGRCVERRPDDPAVLRARLELARANGDLDSVWRAMDRLPADSLAGNEIHRLRAWLAARLGNRAAERSALSDVLRLEPGDTRTLDRLAAIAGEAGDLAEVARLRARTAEMTAVKERYRILLRGESVEDPAELGRLAEALGRPDEARGWSMIRDRKAPGGGPLAAAAESGGETRTVAALCSDLRPSVRQDASVQGGSRPLVVPSFVDGADGARIHFVHENGKTPRKLLPETMSGGLGLLDYDGDGWLDLYAVQGGPFPPAAPTSSSAEGGDRLFRNRGDGTFEDVTARAGFERFPRGYGHGVSVGDYDNDGRPDLFVTRWRSYALYHNKGDGTFEDLTAAAGLGGDRDWPTSAAWADLDGDGDLDLYVCHYLVFDLKDPKICEDSNSRVIHYCSPRMFESLPDHVFRNDGGKFTDVTSGAGFTDPDGRGLGVVAADLDDDNRIDLYVANDMSANYLFRNLGGFKFEETGVAAGCAANSSGAFQSGMGIACGDLDGDGRPDLAVTNYYGESTTLFRNLGRGLFTDATVASGLAAPSRGKLGFGIAFLDANNDGRPDLLSANGHVSDYRPAFPWTMPIQLLAGGTGGVLTDVSTRAGEVFQPLHLGRALTTGDLDNDGLIDAVVQSQNEPLIYLHNQTDSKNHRLTIRLEGTRSNRDGVGARVVVESGGVRQVAQRFGGGSYQSALGPYLHFGLGASERVDRLEVRWPSGQVDRFGRLEVDRAFLLREGEDQARPLPGWDQKPM